MPPRPRIHLTIDTPLLSLPSHDTLVLSRKVNGAFSTALAVASLNPRPLPPTSNTTNTPAVSPLYAQNIFAWDSTFRVAVSYSHSSPSSAFMESGGGNSGALVASMTDAVEISHGQTARFSRNVLMPPVAAGPTISSGGSSSTTGDGVIVGLERLQIGGGSSGYVFSVTDVPPSCRVEVMQSVGMQGWAVRVFQSEGGGLSGVVEVRVENEFILFWTERQVPLGGRVVVSEREGFRMTIEENDDVVFVRYGFLTPNQPRGDELPGWYRQATGSMLVEDGMSSLVRAGV